MTKHCHLWSFHRWSFPKRFHWIINRFHWRRRLDARRHRPMSILIPIRWYAFFHAVTYTLSRGECKSACVHLLIINIHPSSESGSSPSMLSIYIKAWGASMMNILSSTGVWHRPTRQTSILLHFSHSWLRYLLDACETDEVDSWVRETARTRHLWQMHLLSLGSLGGHLPYGTYVPSLACSLEWKHIKIISRICSLLVFVVPVECHYLLKKRQHQQSNLVIVLPCWHLANDLTSLWKSHYVG